MAHKTGVLLSLLILMQCLLLSGNLIHYQVTVARLYAVIPVVNEYLSYQGEITQDIKDYTLNTTGGELTCINYCFAFRGSFLEYQINLTIEPLFGGWGMMQSYVTVIRQKVLVSY